MVARISGMPTGAIPYHGGLCKAGTSRPALETTGLRGDAMKVYTVLFAIAYGYSRASRAADQLPRYVEYAHGLASSGTW